MKRIGLIAAFALATLAAPAAGKPHPNWTATVTVSPSGVHMLGNPDAPVELTEYVSYTCPHCSTFQQQSEAPMRLAYVQPGKLSIRVRHVLRDPVDLTVVMLVNCGDPQGFFKRHNMFLHGQSKWLSRMGGTTEAQRKRWTAGGFSAGMRAIASDLDFYAMMAPLGYSRSAVNQCLADREKAERLAAQSEELKNSGVNSTPSFSLNGLLLAATHDWQTLDLQIRARM